jgi:antitoxin component of RelBE/YafQ-DinJ toxin-antitoxin module
MSKLTLSVDAEVVARAKRYAKQHGVSVSEMVQTYLSAVTRPAVSATDTPVLRALRGTLKSGSREHYRKYISAKYR